MSQTVIPYLTVHGAAEAIDFYKKAFGATENTHMPEPDGKRLLHADLTINGGSLYLSDEFREFSEQGGPAAPKQGSASPVAVTLALNAPADVDRTFEQAVSAGAKSGGDPQDMFWGARFAVLIDPFGHRWMLSAPLPGQK